MSFTRLLRRHRLDERSDQERWCQFSRWVAFKLRGVGVKFVRKNLPMSESMLFRMLNQDLNLFWPSPYQSLFSTGFMPKIKSHCVP